MLGLWSLPWGTCGHRGGPDEYRLHVGSKALAGCEASALGAGEGPGEGWVKDRSPGEGQAPRQGACRPLPTSSLTYSVLLQKAGHKPGRRLQPSQEEASIGRSPP